MAQVWAERRRKAKAEKVKLTLKKRVEKVKGLATKKSKEEKEELGVTKRYETEGEVNKGNCF